MYYFTVKDKYSPLHHAANGGYLLVVEYLIISGADV